MIESLVFLSMMDPNTDGIGSRTNIQSTRTLVAHCRYVLTRREVFPTVEHFPVVIANAFCEGIKPSPAHEKRTVKKNCRFIVQEKAMTA
jgi:hypothetical protein